MMKKMDKKAFTLIELLVVIAVVGILVLLAAPRFTGYTQKAELIRIQHDVKVMEEEVGTVLINGDDEFNEWENNMKDLNQLIEENELFENKGYATELETKDGHYKIIPEEYKDKINTKLKGTFYANSGGKVYYEHGKGPGYSDEEIDNLVKNHGFIPVADAEELNNVRSATLETYGKGTQWEGEYTGGLNKKYVQVADIDLSGYSAEEGWNPIGTEEEGWSPYDTSPSSISFKGIYDGGNYVVRGLKVKGEDKDYQGLFGVTEGATIRNVGLIDNKVTGTSSVGGLVGWAATGTIENSYATGEVTGYRYVGGLVGYADNIIIENSYATGSVTGTGNVGGLVGYANESKINNSYATGEVTGAGNYVGGLVSSASSSTEISNSYATGSVKGKSNAGGLVGEADNRTRISNSYATGEVAGSYAVGGLVGEAFYNTDISNSYATGSVEGTGDYVGGFVGWADRSTIENSYATGEVTVTGTGDLVGGLVGETDGSTVINSYWNKETTGQSTSKGDAIGKTTAEMKDKDTYSGWDFETIWKIDEGNDYPKLR